MLVVSALSLLSDIARADGYSNAAYSGGTFTVNGASYPDNGGSGGAQSTSVSCSGAIKATFTWSGASSPPQTVIVMQSASANAGALRQGPTGMPQAACADGLGDTCSVTTTYPQEPPNSEELSGSASKTEYTVQSGSSPLTLTCSASASGSTTAPQQSANASVSYSAAAYPVTISIGGATSDGKGGQAILVGQHCTASLGGIPNGCVASNWQWSISGDTFQSWSSATPTSEVDGPGSLTNSSAAWYWKDQTQTSETVSCTATVTPPTGQGSAFTVTAKQTVTVMVPTWTNSSGLGGYMKVNAGTSVNLYAGPYPASGESGGMNWALEADTPTAPAFGSGDIQMVQTVTPNRNYVLNGVTHTDPENGSSGLDTNYPYGYVSYQGGVKAMETTRDSPFFNITGTTSAILKDKFVDYLMYKPPGTASTWVTLASFTWNCGGSATIPRSGNWADYVTQNGSDSAGSITDTPFTASSTFPQWAIVKKFPQF